MIDVLLWPTLLRESRDGYEAPATMGQMLSLIETN